MAWGSRSGVLDDREPERGAAGRRLDHERHAELVGDPDRGGGAHLAEGLLRQRDVGGDVEARPGVQALRDRLVPRDRRREHVGTGVGQVEELEQGLDRAVLTGRAVQGEERDVERPVVRCRTRSASTSRRVTSCPRSAGRRRPGPERSDTSRSREMPPDRTATCVTGLAPSMSAAEPGTGAALLLAWDLGGREVAVDRLRTSSSSSCSSSPSRATPSRMRSGGGNE
jgi:hypothetical protein